MKSTFILMVFLVFVTQAFAQRHNTFIRGNLNGFQQKEWLYLSGLKNGYRDSVQQDADGFKFELYIPEGEGDFYILQAGRGDPSNGIFLYLEKGNLKVSSKTTSLMEAKYSGGKLAYYYNTFQNRPKVEELENLYSKVTKERKNSANEKLKDRMEQLNKAKERQKELDKDFVLKYRNSPVVVYPLYFTLRDRNNMLELDELLKHLGTEAKRNIPVKEMEYSVKMEKLKGIGRSAPPFSQTDTSGNIVSLNDFRGKYVLIDFWASWCVPCRKENPNIVSAYQQYKNKNFTVLGVSFDYPGRRDRWIEAICTDNLHWTQLSDLKGWKNEVGSLYDIKSIPSNLLIDPKGVIIAKNLKREALDEKLKELLGEPQMDPATFVIKGHLDNSIDASWFYLRYERENGDKVLDSARIFNGVFSYIGHIDYPTISYCYFGKGDGVYPQGREHYFDFYIEPGVITLSGDSGSPEKMQISGSKVQKENIAFQRTFDSEVKMLRPITEQYYQINGEIAALRKQGAEDDLLAKKSEELEQLKKRMELLQRAVQEKQLDYIKEHPNSYISVSNLRVFISSLPLQEIEHIYAQVCPEIKNSKIGQEISHEIAKLKSGSPGSPAKDFEGNDINDRILRLSDYRGKYVLLDFWASWCVPCRKSNPHLRSLYYKYKKKGFEIISISDDDNNSTAWKKAVEQDKISVWKHVLRGLKHFGDGTFDYTQDKSKYYGIHTLPTKILIDPQGIIVGRYGSGGESDEEMNKKLVEIFGV